jgi:hypothetical protein
MKTICFAAPLFLGSALLAAQAPAPAAAQTHTDPLGFSYSLPADWELLDMQPAIPAIRQQFEKDATTQSEKKGLECVQITFTARHGDPPSAILAVTLPFDCLGMTMKDSDLPAFGMGTAEGLKKSWTIADPHYGAYTLGTHSMWIERATGSPIDHPEVQRTLEVVCGLLKKGAVCWMAFAADDASLKLFEQSPVTIENSDATALVPANAFATKP